MSINDEVMAKLLRLDADVTQLKKRQDKFSAGGKEFGLHVKKEITEHVVEPLLELIRELEKQVAQLKREVAEAKDKR